MNKPGFSPNVAAATKIMTHAEALTPLVTDCLRLSTHFFYPIQQCAQHVYYTALPLSPTSSHLRKSCLQSGMVNQLSRVTAFSGAPDTWGLLLRTINVRPRGLTHLATSAQRIIAACEDIVNVYDAVTFVFRQSLRAPKTVTKIRDSPDGSTLFFAHSHSVTMWDVQTGGLVHTFTTQSEITEITVAKAGDRIACGSSDGSVAVWNIRTKGEDKGFGDGQPVVTIYWLSPAELVVATQRTVYVHSITTGKTLRKSPILGRVWGMVYLGDEGEFLVGTSQPGLGGQESHFLRINKSELLGHALGSQGPELHFTRTLRYLGGLFFAQSLDHLGPLLRPTLVGEKIACITPPSGVRSFNTKSCDWTKIPPLLDAATSVAVSLNRNLVAQTKDSIQIFSLDVLTSLEAREDVPFASHVYPLGEKHIVCLLQPDRYLIILELETLQKLHPDDNPSPLGPLPTDQSPSARASFSHGFVEEFGAPVVIQAWRSGTPLPEWTETADENPPLSGLSPSRTRIVTLYGSPRRELRVKDAEDGTTLANLLLGDEDLDMGEVYDVRFDSDTRFHLKIDGPGRHVQIPHDIIASPSGPHSHTITKGEPEPLSEPRATPPYILDTNCEWVIDAKSRKICWISPGDVRRGNGGHFWTGLSLVMVGDDGVVRKLSFREPGS